jgi:isopentenyldiphosphate isomerase
LEKWPTVFTQHNKTVCLNDNIRERELRNKTLDKIILSLISLGYIKTYLNEPYPVTAGDRSLSLMTIDRSAVSHFGLRSFGQHLCGYVQKKDGIHSWVARRARDRYIAPGKLDNMVAGGLPWHISLQQNLIKECAEEAGMEEDLSRQSQATGTISYFAESDKGLKPDTLFCYDIELPESFVPVCTDGEVESFELMPINDVMEIICNTDDLRPNCNLVIIDFIIRHGLLDPEQPGYADLVKNLHQ